MLVTITTDAAFHPQHQAAGYAFWIACDAGRYAYSGNFRAKVKRPEIAEFKCIINAIHAAIVKFKPNKIIVNTDCLNVIHLVTNNKKAIRLYGLGSWGKHLVIKYDQLLAKGKISPKSVTFRHVKSHVSTLSKREWVNEWCDQNAKMKMWDAIKSKTS